MEILPGIEIVDLGIFVREKSILIISDIHIGYEEELNSKGFMIPRTNFKEMLDRLGAMLWRTKPATIVITGDLKHEFGDITKQEWRDTLRFIDFLSKHAKEIILLKGNHDTFLGPVVKKRNFQLKESFSCTSKKYKIFVCHGDRIPETKEFQLSDIIIIGHEHPAISITNDIRTEKYKCFLLGEYKNKGKKKKLIVMPSLNLSVEGSDVLNGKALSPFLEKGVGDFHVYIPNKEDVLHFGKVKNI